MIDASESSSTRPYLIRALYEWCTDNGFTPFIAVLVDETVRVPTELKISFDATSALNIGNAFIEFKGRFGGVARDIYVPVDRVLAIYARENGQGMAFPMLAASASGSFKDTNAPVDAKPAALTRVTTSESDDGPGSDTPRPSGAAKPALTRIK